MNLGLLGEGTAIAWSDISSVFSNITSQFSVASIISVLGGAFGIAIGFVFMWFGIKKALAILKPAINGGSISSGGGKRRG